MPSTILCELNDSVYLATTEGPLVRLESHSDRAYLSDSSILVQVAPAPKDIYDVDTFMQSLLVVSGEIYGVTSDGVFYKWNGIDYYRVDGSINELSGWVFLAPSVDGRFPQALLYHDNKIFCLLENGKLLQWNSVDSWLIVALPYWNYLYNLSSDLISYNGVLYHSEYDKFVKWNGVDSWVLVCDSPFSGGNCYFQLFEYDHQLYCLTYSPSRIYSWDGNVTWELEYEFIDEIPLCFTVWQPISFYGYPPVVYFGSQSGKLLVWDPINGLIQLCLQREGTTQYISCLLCTSKFIYGRGISPSELLIYPLKSFCGLTIQERKTPDIVDTAHLTMIVNAFSVAPSLYPGFLNSSMLLNNVLNVTDVYL